HRGRADPYRLPASDRVGNHEGKRAQRLWPFSQHLTTHPFATFRRYSPIIGRKERVMEGIGWIGAIIIGGLAGWIAEQIMKSDQGLLMNIVMGIVGAIVANAILVFVFGNTL